MSLRQPITIKGKIKYNNKKQQSLRKGENLISRVTALLDLNVQSSTTEKKKNHIAYKVIGKHGPFQVKNNNSIKIVPEKGERSTRQRLSNNHLENVQRTEQICGEGQENNI